jgi:hypothetical protein
VCGKRFDRIWSVLVKITLKIKWSLDFVASSLGLFFGVLALKKSERYMLTHKNDAYLDQAARSNWLD